MNNENKKYTRIEKALKLLPWLSESYIKKVFCPCTILDELKDSIDNPIYCKGITCEECWDKEL